MCEFQEKDLKFYDSKKKSTDFFLCHNRHNPLKISGTFPLLICIETMFLVLKSIAFLSDNFCNGLFRYRGPEVYIYCVIWAAKLRRVKQSCKKSPLITKEGKK
jgi:hypothetical protein